MRKTTDLISNEVAHGRKISGNAEFYWGWSGTAGMMRAERRAGMFRTAGKLTPGKKALEIGCGTGLFTAKVARSGADITAVELSPDLIEVAREKNNSGNIKYLVMNVEELDFPDNSFDCVYGSSVLHHMNLQKVLPETLRVLKPGGDFVFTEPNMLNPQIMIKKNIKLWGKLIGESPDETAFFRWEIEKILQKAGFSGAVALPFDFLHPWVPGPFAPAINALCPFLERLPLFREIAGSLLIRATK